jgi:hypothetical protein
MTRRLTLSKTEPAEHTEKEKLLEARPMKEAITGEGPKETARRIVGRGSGDRPA